MCNDMQKSFSERERKALSLTYSIILNHDTVREELRQVVHAFCALCNLLIVLQMIGEKTLREYRRLETENQLPVSVKKAVKSSKSNTSTSSSSSSSASSSSSSSSSAASETKSDSKSS